MAIDGQQVSVRPRSAFAEISSCGPWQMAATGLPVSIASRARSTIACRRRILSGAWPPGMTSASKSRIRASPAAMSEVTVASPRFPRNDAPRVGPTIVTSAPAARKASRGPVSSRSSNSSSTRIATRLPASDAESAMSALRGDSTPEAWVDRFSRIDDDGAMNRLARERSPYLLQHAQNPVEWFAWGDEAFAKAASEDKPIFLSVGYSTCHWCHVMEHESFENDAVAAVLNQHFVSIKVDREERPDVDRVYMTFVQATTGSGGWPMSVWLTPDLKPFYGGTYFPPTSRWGRPGFVDILQEIARVWRAESEKVRQSADALTSQLRGAGRTSPGAAVPEPEALERTVAQFRQSF